MFTQLFFPGLQRKREEVVRLTTKLYHHLDSNFKSVNQLIDCLHEHLPGRKFRKVYIDDEETIKDNCDRLARRIKEIQKYLEETSLKIKEKLDPKIFEELADSRVGLGSKFSKAHKAIGANWSSFTYIGVTLACHLSTISGLVGIGISLFGIMSCNLALLAVGVCFLALGAIIGLIQGLIEDSQLDEKIAELNAALNKFEPESDKFNDTVYRVITRIQIAMEN